MSRPHPVIVTRPSTDTVVMVAEDVEAAITTYLRAARATPPDGALMAAGLAALQARVSRLENVHQRWVNSHYQA